MKRLISGSGARKAIGSPLRPEGSEGREYSLASRVFLSLSSFILSLVLAEALLRVFFSEQLFLDERFMTPSVLVHHDYIPDVTFRRSPAPGETFHPVYVRVNSFGMRGPLPGPKSSHRVLNVGDSFVEAVQVDYEETFGARLNAAFKGRVEFLSHGISSWAPTTEFSWIHHKGLTLEPDEVDLFLCGNDFFRASVYESADASYRRQAVYEGRVPVGYRLESVPVLEKARRGLALTRLLIRARSGARRLLRGREQSTTPKKASDTEYSAIGAEYALLGEPSEAWPEELREAIEGTVQVVRDLNEYLRRRGVKLNVLIVPSGFAWEDECTLSRPAYGWTLKMTASQAGLESYLRSALAAGGIPFVDLRKAFEDAKRLSPGQRLYDEADCHWNRQGHAVVFECLKAFHEVPPAGGPSGTGPSRGGGEAR